MSRDDEQDEQIELLWEAVGTLSALVDDLMRAVFDDEHQRPGIIDVPGPDTWEAT